jgi:hypothetical protein
MPLKRPSADAVPFLKSGQIEAVIGTVRFANLVNDLSSKTDPADAEVGQAPYLCYGHLITDEAQAGVGG